MKSVHSLDANDIGSVINADQNSHKEIQHGTSC